MRRSATHRELSDGIRALRCFARHVPIGIGEFAGLARLHPDEARTLIAAFEQGGFVRPAPHGPLFLLTPLGLGVLGPESPLGPLTTRAIEVIDRLASSTGEPATLSIRRGAHMLFCLASRPQIPGGLRVGTRRELLHCPQGLVQIACQSTVPLDPQANSVRENGYIMTGGVRHPVLAVAVMHAGRAEAILSLHGRGPTLAKSWHDLLPIVQAEAVRLGQDRRPALNTPHALQAALPARSPDVSH